MLGGANASLSLSLSSCNLSKLSKQLPQLEAVSPIHLFLPPLALDGDTGSGGKQQHLGERGASERALKVEMDFQCLFDFLQISLLRKHIVGWAGTGFYPLL